MAIVPFLAMTAAEMGNVSVFPQKTAWMACHFSPYGLGLSNLPRNLPPQSLLILDDITPIRSHDPGIISTQLQECIRHFGCLGLLLDFQRPCCPEASALIKHLTDSLPCPVIVSACYSGDSVCPVFLPPVPPSVPLREYLLPWEGRDIWLEPGLAGEILTLTEDGCHIAESFCPDPDETGLPEETLHCHYTVDTNEKSARFTLWRTADDLKALLEDAGNLGVTNFVGLYQELRHHFTV